MDNAFSSICLEQNLTITISIWLSQGIWVVYLYGHWLITKGSTIIDLGEHGRKITSTEKKWSWN